MSVVFKVPLSSQSLYVLLIVVSLGCLSFAVQNEFYTAVFTFIWRRKVFSVINVNQSLRCACGDITIIVQYVTCAVNWSFLWNNMSVSNYHSKQNIFLCLYPRKQCFFLSFFFCCCCLCLKIQTDTNKITKITSTKLLISLTGNFLNIVFMRPDMSV